MHTTIMNLQHNTMTQGASTITKQQIRRRQQKERKGSTKKERKGSIKTKQKQKKQRYRKHKERHKKCM